MSFLSGKYYSVVKDPIVIKDALQMELFFYTELVDMNLLAIKNDDLYEKFYQYLLSHTLNEGVVVYSQKSQLQTKIYHSQKMTFSMSIAVDVIIDIKKKLH